MNIRATRKAVEAVRLLDHAEERPHCEGLRTDTVGACRHGWYALAEPGRIFDTQRSAESYALYLAGTGASQ